MWGELQRSLESQLSGSFEVTFTQQRGHATELTRQAVQTGVKRIVCVGGDGTLNEVVNGLFVSDPMFGIGEDLIQPDVELAVARQGTGGDFARFLDLSESTEDTFAHLSSSKKILMDIGLCLFRTQDGQSIRRAFANVASFGLSGLVVKKMNTSNKLLGSLSYIGPTGAGLLEYRRRSVRILVDGTIFYEGPLLTGALGNACFFGGGMKIAPDAVLDDGLLDVVILKNGGLSEMRKCMDLYSGRHVYWESAETTRGQYIEAYSLDSSPCLLDLDGEQPGVLDARFHLVPKAVLLQVPEDEHQSSTSETPTRCGLL